MKQNYVIKWGSLDGSFVFVGKNNWSVEWIIRGNLLSCGTITDVSWCTFLRPCLQWNIKFFKVHFYLFILLCPGPKFDLVSHSSLHLVHYRHFIVFLCLFLSVSRIISTLVFAFDTHKSSKKSEIKMWHKVTCYVITQSS